MLKLIRLVMLVLISYLYYVRIDEGQLGLKAWIAVAVLIYTVNHFFIMSERRSHTIAFICVALDLLVIASFGFLFAPSTLYIILFGVEATTLFLLTNEKRPLLLFAAVFFICWMSVLAYTYMKTGEIAVLENILNFMFFLFNMLVGTLIRKLMSAREIMNAQYTKLNESHEELKYAHEQLRLYAKEVEELTVIRERNSIAREIHDTVGHNMTALLFQLQLAQELLKQSSEQTEQTLQTCYKLAHNSLQEVRLSVRTLKEDEGEQYTLVSAIRDILEEFAETTRVETSFFLTGDPAAVPTSLYPTICRIVQESLTNAKRHGKASKCEVRLVCESKKATLRIEDDGKGASTVVTGFGLMNMKERVEEHGGTIRYESKEGIGFQVQAEFPMREKKWLIGGTV